METSTNEPGSKDNTTLWIIVAVIVAGAIAYTAYAAYYGSNRNDTVVTTTDSNIRNTQ